MCDERSSTSDERRLIYWLIAMALISAVIIWLFSKLGIPFTPIIARSLVWPLL